MATRCKVAAGSAAATRRAPSGMGAALVGAQFLDQAGGQPRARGVQAARCADVRRRTIWRSAHAPVGRSTVRPRTLPARRSSSAWFASQAAAGSGAAAASPLRASASRLVQFLQGADIRAGDGHRLPGPASRRRWCWSPRSVRHTIFPPLRSAPKPKSKLAPDPTKSTTAAAPPPSLSGRTSGCPRRCGRSLRTRPPRAQVHFARSGCDDGGHVAQLARHPDAGQPHAAGAQDQQRILERQHLLPCAVRGQSGAGMVQACSSGMAPWSTR